MKNEVNPVEDFFLRVLRGNSDKDCFTEDKYVFASYDWDRLYALATRSGLHSAFYSGLSSLKLTNIPSDFILRIKNIYFLNLQRNILLEQELFRILAYFQELKIPVIPLKGPVLARYLYGDVALRQSSCDLDLLFQPELREEIVKALNGLGYEFSGIERKKDFLLSGALSKKLEQLNFSCLTTGGIAVSLDLHFSIRGFYADEELVRIWRKLQYYEVCGQRIALLSNEDMLIYLCMISITSGEFVQSKYIYDIHKLITEHGKNFNWENLSGHIKKSGLNNCLYFPLNLTQDMFLTDIPPFFLEGIKPGWLARHTLANWLNKDRVLRCGHKDKTDKLLRYLLARHLYSSGFIDFFNKSIGRLAHRWVRRRT